MCSALPRSAPRPHSDGRRFTHHEGPRGPCRSDVRSSRAPPFFRRPAVGAHLLQEAHMWISLTALAFAVASTCAGGSPPDTASSRTEAPDVTDAPRGLVVEVATDQSTVGPTGRLQVKVTTTNTGKSAV